MADNRRDTTLTLTDGDGLARASSARIAGLLPVRYTDQGLIGTGGMGEVRRVQDRVLARTVAMKVMRLVLATSPSARLRFIREAQVTAGLQHPGIVAVHDQGELADGRLWYTMQEVRGETLEAMLPAVPLRRRVEVLARVAQAVGFAHRASIIHRDLKPS
ncbi:MAG: protein kinase, partial [Myxococcales bacterium]|nr:protein kinase [Myxococcales bacterium]